MIQLPIDAHIPEILDLISSHSSLVLVAPPGTGKTTRVPPALLGSAVRKPEQEIIVLEPRRLAAKMSAERVADEMNEDIGRSIGYAFRGENKISIIPVDIPQPERALGIMTRKKPYSNPAGRKFVGHLRREFSELRRAVERHEKTIQWVQGPFMGDRKTAVE